MTKRSAVVKAVAVLVLAGIDAGGAVRVGSQMVSNKMQKVVSFGAEDEASAGDLFQVSFMPTSLGNVVAGSSSTTMAKLASFMPTSLGNVVAGSSSGSSTPLTNAVSPSMTRSPSSIFMTPPAFNLDSKPLVADDKLIADVKPNMFGPVGKKRSLADIMKALEARENGEEFWTAEEDTNDRKRKAMFEWRKQGIEVAKLNATTKDLLTTFNGVGLEDVRVTYEKFTEEQDRLKESIADIKSKFVLDKSGIYIRIGLALDAPGLDTAMQRGAQKDGFPARAASLIGGLQDSVRHYSQGRAGILLDPTHVEFLAASNSDFDTNVLPGTQAMIDCAYVTKEEFTKASKVVKDREFEWPEEGQARALLRDIKAWIAQKESAAAASEDAAAASEDAVAALLIKTGLVNSLSHYDQQCVLDAFEAAGKRLAGGQPAEPTAEPTTEPIDLYRALNGAHEGWKSFSKWSAGNTFARLGPGMSAGYNTRHDYAPLYTRQTRDLFHHEVLERGIVPTKQKKFNMAGPSGLQITSGMGSNKWWWNEVLMMPKVSRSFEDAFLGIYVTPDVCEASKTELRRFRSVMEQTEFEHSKRTYGEFPIMTATADWKGLAPCEV